MQLNTNTNVFEPKPGYNTFLQLTNRNFILLFQTFNIRYSIFMFKTISVVASEYDTIVFFSMHSDHTH